MTRGRAIGPQRPSVSNEKARGKGGRWEEEARQAHVVAMRPCRAWPLCRGGDRLRPALERRQAAGAVPSPPAA